MGTIETPIARVTAGLVAGAFLALLAASAVCRVVHPVATPAGSWHVAMRGLLFLALLAGAVLGGLWTRNWMFGDAFAIRVLASTAHHPRLDLVDMQPAVAALGEFGPDAIPPLLELIDDPRDIMSWCAADELAKMRSAAAPAVPGLIAMISDPNTSARTRARAIHVLADIGPSAAPAIPVLQAVVEESRSADLRSFAAVALGRLGPAAASAIPGLRRAAAEAPNETYRLYFENAVRRILGEPIRSR